MFKSKTHYGSMIKRLMLWSEDRFPLKKSLFYFVLFIASYLTSYYASGNKPEFSWKIVTGCIMVFSFFLLLRIFDEHKDYEDDCIHHPGRVLQRGIVTLRDLKIVGAVCIIIQLAGCIIVDRGMGQATLYGSIVFIWVCLMGKEFFIGEWLKQHLMWYAISHMLVMPLLILWLDSIASPDITLSLPVFLLMALAFFSGFSFEIVRKCKGPDEDREEVPSYSSVFGRKRTVGIIYGLLTVMLIIQLILINVTVGHIYPWTWIILLLIYILALLQIYLFLNNPCIKNRKRNENITALFMVAGYLVYSIDLFIAIY